MPRIISNLKRNSAAKSILGSGLVGLIIKVGAAALSLLMFAAIARVTSTEDFGTFGFSFSLATVLAVVGSMGQRMFGLKSAAISYDSGDISALTNILLSGIIIVTCGTALFSLALYTFSPRNFFGEDAAIIFATTLFAVSLAIVEYIVHFFRGFRTVAASLLPRDIAWRFLVIIFCIFVAVTMSEVEALTVIFFMALALLSVSVVQIFLDPVGRNILKARSGLRRSLMDSLKRSKILWGTSIVQTVGGPVLTPVILGIFLSPEEVGPFFAAMRIALVMDLFTMAASMVISPMVARMIEFDRRDELQRSLALSSFAVCLATTMFFVVFLIFGTDILAFMNPDFAAAAPALSVLAFGYLVSVFCGPVPSIMELAGMEASLLKWLVWTNTICFIAIFPAIHFFGMLGASICVAGLKIFIHLAMLTLVRRRLGVNPSITSVVRMLK